jgi:hypothetical protein
MVLHTLVLVQFQDIQRRNIAPDVFVCREGCHVAFPTERGLSAFD